MSIRVKIKQLRQAHDLSQTELASLVGKTRNWASKIESGVIKDLQPEDRETLALYFNVEPAYLIDKPGEDSGQLMPIDTLAEDKQHHFKSKNEKIEYLNDENRKLLRENAYLKSILLEHRISIYNISK